MNQAFFLEEGDRQMTIRGLAVQSLRAPGFEFACRQIAKVLSGEEMFDSFRESLRDVEPPADRNPQDRAISSLNEIGLYLHCGLCFEEWKAGKAPEQSMSGYQLNEAGWTDLGLQVWCRRHDCNVAHIDFQGVQHPANTTRTPA